MTTRTAPILTANPGANYLAHKAEIDQAVQRVLESGWYILGEEVSAFENSYSSWLGAKHSIGVANGTDAVEIALRACGVGSDSLVLTVSNTAVATVAAVERCGAFPIFVDVNQDTFTMDPDSLEHTLRLFEDPANRPGGRVAKAVLPVHLYGLPADLPAIIEIAERYGLYVIEDCAQAHGSDINGKKTGTWGHVGAFSLYPTKNLGALGDGGVIVTGDDRLAEKIHLIRQYGWKERYISELPGVNSRLDPIQAAILQVKLRYLDEENQKRRDLAAIYDDLLRKSGIVLPVCPPGRTHVYHQYTIRTSQRDELMKHLREQSVIAQILYPVPIHLQPAYQNRVPALTSLRITEQHAGEIISLPIYPELGSDTARTVAGMIAYFFSESRA
jgi:dTDP-4-amino-4,6-dideoxygalactose transaminase